MKIRGNTVGTPIKPEKVLVRCENLTEEEKAQARANIGAASLEELDSVSADTPVFDLDALGIADIPFSGGYAQLETDTTEMMEALAKGPVIFVIPLVDGEETLPVSVIMNNVGTGDSYICSALIASDTNTTITVMVQSGMVAVLANTLETGSSITVDSEMSETSENPVQNKVVYAAFAEVGTAIETLGASIPTDDHINSLIDAKLGVIENGTY